MDFHLHQREKEGIRILDVRGHLTIGESETILRSPKLHAIKAELIRRKHEPTALVGKWLRQVTLGYYQYHAVPGNLNRMAVFMHHLRRMWRAVLARRSQRGQVSWQRHSPILDRWIPFPRVLHPYPQQRFAARHPR
jgi:RNA-directed DNA polymerase